ncbi:MAG: hypothetical protein KDB23_15310 [Planctomycetales bacterium]|nr:hypothetical protein [Planctomycetales bacterium]
MKRYLVFALAMLFAGCAVNCFAQSFEAGAYNDGHGNRMSYRLWRPPGEEEPEKEFPVIVWMHGAGGSNSSVPQGLIDAVQSERFAAYLISPQGSPPVAGGGPWATCYPVNPLAINEHIECPEGATRSMESVLGILDELDLRFPIDSSRRFAVGYSAGGVGAFESILRHSDVFSAAVSIAGGYVPELITEAPDARLWALHGQKDSLLFPYWSSHTVQQIIESGGAAIYLEPPGGHDVIFMDSFFEDANDELYPWLFEGVEPTLARLLYDPSNGNVKVDAESGPGGAISSMSISTSVDLRPAAVTEIDGDTLTMSNRSLRYTATGAGFSGVVDLGNILPEGLDFTQLHTSIISKSYDSPASATSKRTFRLVVVPPGDFDTSGYLGASDIELISSEVAAGTNDTRFDLNSDAVVNADDVRIWVKDLKGTWFGDANLDGEFNSSDLVQAFQSGEYEDGVAMNSGWAEGDWNGDADFDSGDLVFAFQDGGYEQGMRAAKAAAAVPEPTGSASVILVAAVILSRRQRQ